MNAQRVAGVLLALGLAAQALPAVRAEDEPKKAAVKTGGNFEVEVLRDVAYTDDKEADARNRHDLYVPKGQKGFPVLVYAHGGGWSKGDRKSFEKQGRLLARNGIGVVAAGYRLTPQVKHPVHAQDLAKAVAWTRKNIEKHGGRPDQIFLAGHSAGGHLVALVGTDPSYLKAEGMGLSDIKGVIPISGVYTIQPGRMAAVFGKDEDGCRAASPQHHVKGNHPPFLILYADKDGKDFDKMAEEFSKALRAAKCEAACQCVEGRTHGTILSSAASQGDPVTQAILEFISRHAGLKLTVQ